MNMHWVDWGIILIFAAFILVQAYGTKKYTKSVADFLAANRCAGKYILAMGDGMAGLGAIGLIAGFQQFYEGGFTVIWWQSIIMPLGVFVAITGWVIYRFRQTRALTMAQFFEVRYSKRLRIFAGFLAFVSGIINFGIFPSAGSRFFIYFTGLPQTFPVAGLEVSTYAVVMATLIGTALLFTCLGGQIAVIVTDFTQMFFCGIVFIIVVVILFFKFDWTQIASTISVRPQGQSMINPFQIGGLKNYDTFFYLILCWVAFYGAYSWQGQQAYNTSATSAHEARMSKILSLLRFPVAIIFVAMLTLCAYTLMHHGDFSGRATEINDILSTIENDQIKKQMTVPIAMGHVLPVGVAGLLCAVMFAAFVSTHDTYMHSWASIFMQDVILPFRKKPFTPRAHIWYLRLSLFGVSVFIFLFSYLLYQQTDIIMFLVLAGTIFLGGSGAVIIGGLYWKRGTTAGAWASMIVGLIMAVIGFILVLGWPQVASALQESWPAAWQRLKGIAPKLNSENFIFTAQELFFFTTIVCSIIYLVVSLLSRAKPFDMDRMLHRGKYAIESEKSPEEELGLAKWKKALGFGKNLAWDDKLIVIFSYSYIFLFIGVFVFGSIYHWIFGIPENFWLPFWHGCLWVFFGLTVVVTVWMSIGGILDMKKMFALLKTVKRDNRDDGMVVDHHNLDEEPG